MSTTASDTIWHAASRERIRQLETDLRRAKELAQNDRAATLADTYTAINNLGRINPDHPADITAVAAILAAGADQIAAIDADEADTIADLRRRIAAQPAASTVALPGWDAAVDDALAVVA